MPAMHPLEAKLGYAFRDPAHLSRALVHGSSRNERPGDGDNQRMEFLGDAALGLSAAGFFYHRDPDAPEGALTLLRSQATSTTTLAMIAEDIDLGAHLVLGRGEETSGGRHKKKNLADTLEAVIGAAYLDGGLPAVDTIFQHLFAPRLPRASTPHAANPKGALQEWAQRHGHPCPTYSLVSESGPPHARTFVVRVHVGRHAEAEGEGDSKRRAEAAAAARLLDHVHTL